MLAQFERAERIRRMFFSPGSKTPGAQLHPETFDSRLLRDAVFVVNIDDQLAAVEPGAEERASSGVAWSRKTRDRIGHVRGSPRRA